MIQKREHVSVSGGYGLLEVVRSEKSAALLYRGRPRTVVWHRDDLTHAVRGAPSFELEHLYNPEVRATTLMDQAGPILDHFAHGRFDLSAREATIENANIEFGRWTEVLQLQGPSLLATVPESPLDKVPQAGAPAIGVAVKLPLLDVELLLAGHGLIRAYGASRPMQVLTVRLAQAKEVAPTEMARLVEVARHDAIRWMAREERMRVDTLAGRQVRR